MSLPINLDSLINGKTIESERIEFKAGWNPGAIIHSVCAFANDLNNWSGGYIIVGIDQKDGKPVLPPVGLKENQVDKIQKSIIGLCYLINPNYTPVIEPEIYLDKRIIVIWVPGGDNRPYEAPISLGKRKKSVRVQWVRKGPCTVKASTQDKRRLMELASKIPFDDRVNHKSTLEDLELREIKFFLKEVKSDLFKQADELSREKLFRKMNIVKGPGEYLKPVNIGLLMFNESPNVFFRGAEIQIVIYEDEVGDNFIEKNFQGPLPYQLRNALQFIKANVIKTKTRKVSFQAEALRFINYPFEAVEEALANAVYHKSYEHQSCIEINVRLDRLEILSIPGPLPPLDNEMLKRPRIVARDYRNRRIGDFLKELRLTEGRGTGIPKMRLSMKKNGSPIPMFETDDDSTYFLSILPIHPEFIDLILDEYKISVLQYCVQPRTRREILKKIGLSSHYGNFRRHALPLIQSGYLDLTLPEIPTSRKQRYVVSEKGLSKLAPIA